MLFFLLLSYLGSGASGRVTPITKSSFKRFIEKRPKNEIWFVMFHTDSNFQSQKLYPKFLNASVMAGGMFRFGVIDTKQQPLLTRQFKPKQRPSFIVFHQKGQTEYEGSGEPDDIIEFASQYLTDNTIEVDETWLKDLNSQNSKNLPRFDQKKNDQNIDDHHNSDDAKNYKKPMAILFTKKKNTPILWTGISHVFANKNVKIGVCRNESLFKYFDAQNVPQIVFINNTYNFKYTKKNHFANIERSLNKFLSKSLKVEKDEVPDVIMPSDDFASECIGRLKTCIIYSKQEEDPSYNEMFRVYKTMQFKWFKGTKGIPFDFIKENEIWVYNPKIDGFLKIDHVTLMGPILQKVYDSDVEWTRKFDLLNQNREL
ncbi:hypothetical protein TRFO_33231 [Tritrichomonas foetus]|uniref:Thioredoxin domain-containing protein n=1 Tax=Tritrichomonas foetus TaxID=1144522 RepID=A0A1J4JSD9_9EUKA|nr:hypothetical protein TRFO_33231 [Tritrichomonas foetus]|eukprot:OHT00157.1 hypothetical protein TRFO_33231 [Tritrichomonas foetus]